MTIAGRWPAGLIFGMISVLGVALSAKEPDRPKTSDDTTARGELRNLAERTYDETLHFYESGEATPSEVYQSSRRWLEQELALAANAEATVVAQQTHLDRMRELANIALWRSSEVEYFVAEAEMQLNKVEPDPKFGPTIVARQALQGDWDVVSAEEDGAAVKKPDLKSLTMLGRRGEFVFRLGSARAMITIDPTTKPAEFDVFGFNEQFPFGGHGIYRLEGDKLTICWASQGDRPTGFETHADDGHHLYVLKKSTNTEKPAE